MALTDTDLQVVIKHVKRMLPAMLIETAPRSHLQGDASATAPGNYAEEPLARFVERTAQEFRALRELMQAGFEAVDKRFEDMNKRFEDMNKRFEEMNANIDKRFADGGQALRGDERQHRQALRGRWTSASRT